MSLMRCPLSGSDRCLLCYENAKGRASHKGHCSYRPARKMRRDEMAKFVRRASGAVASPQPGNRTAGYPMADSHPALWEYLTLGEWEDGTVRQTATLSVFWGTNGLQGALNDREAGTVAFVTADSVEAILASLEHGLQHDALDWRASFQGKGQKKRK